MKYLLVLAMLLGSVTMVTAEDEIDGVPDEQVMNVVPMPMNGSDCGCSNNMMMQNTGCVCDNKVLGVNKTMIISVVGQGVAPINTASPAQAYALAKRAAVADAYRLIAEKVKGVRIDGQDLVQNMMVKRSTVRTSVAAMVRNANIVETTFKEGLCEVEMEITLNRSQFPQ